MRRFRQKLEEFVFGGTDPIRLQVFRSLFALTLLVYIFDRAQSPYEWLTWEGFHVSPEYITGFKWRPPLLSKSLVVPFLGLYTGCIALLIISWRARLMTWLVFFGTVYITMADSQTAYSLNYMYIYGLLALGLAPAPRLTRENGALLLRQSIWPVRVLQATLLVQYFGAGACKVLHGDWLQVDGVWAPNPNVLWSQVQGVYCTDLCAWMLRTLPRWTWNTQQHLALGFELFGPFLLMFRRTRPLAMLVGFGFQTIIGLTMYKVGFFSAQILAFYVLFFSPLFLRRIADLLHRSNRQPVAGSR